jgi:hypothetical protein
VEGYVFTREGFTVFKTHYEKYTGSFDDPLSLKILAEEADIVCTNPPFSKAIDYWKIVIGSGKQFLIVSNIINAVSTAYIHYFKDNKVWAGYNSIDKYLNSKKQLVEAAGHWYTNLPITDRPKYKHLKIMPLEEIPAKYKEYDDSNMLVVHNGYIPSGYEAPFAVSTRPILNGLLEKGYEIIQDKKYEPFINGRNCFARVLVRALPHASVFTAAR